MTLFFCQIPISKISSKKILIDPLTCSVFFKTIIKKNNLILEKTEFNIRFKINKK